MSDAWVHPKNQTSFDPATNKGVHSAAARQMQSNNFKSRVSADYSAHATTTIRNDPKELRHQQRSSSVPGLHFPSHKQGWPALEGPAAGFYAMMVPQSQFQRPTRHRTYHRNNCEVSIHFTESHATHSNPSPKSMWLTPSNGKPGMPYVHRVTDEASGMRVHSTGCLSTSHSMRPVSAP
mmetsp:Transcript_166349/g.534314  ORF Transcript_166349/g.534314 Transcript_166349/m.534314 type:complete len:179 (+) Transcript_166349:82-618(+)